ncbi:MAG TPA: Mur ligase domain-containing protein, partial [Polyangiaceae bacterium]|nr:Mur ligase domain-containing protein [Polyangiaceae bacterium]
MTSPLRADGALLSQIAQRLGGTLHGKEDPRITGLHHDSRKIEPGDLFVARQGERSDGSQFITQAVEQGAVAVMTATMPPTEPAVPVLLVDNVRTVLGQAANVIYADPTSRLDVVGITGTNGKTTTSYLVRAAIDGAGGRSGVLGTLGAAFENLHFPASH